MNETILIYALHDALGIVRYVGRTSNMKHRSIEHMKTRTWFHHHSILEIVHPQEAASSEHKWIAYYYDHGAPLENKNMPASNRAPDCVLVHRAIKQASHEKGISLSAIATIAGTTRMAISHVVRGTSRSRRLRRVLCNELNLDPLKLGWNNIADQYDADTQNVIHKHKKEIVFTIVPKA